MDKILLILITLLAIFIIIKIWLKISKILFWVLVLVLAGVILVRVLPSQTICTEDRCMEVLNKTLDQSKTLTFEVNTTNSITKEDCTIEFNKAYINYTLSKCYITSTSYNNSSNQLLANCLCEYKD